MNKLFINKQEVHLSDQTKIGVTKQANNIADLEMRQGGFTNVFKIPVNDHNNVILEWAAYMSSNTDLPYKRLLATYEEDGVELVSEGDAQIVNVSNGFYFIKVVDGNIDLKKALGGVTVGELYSDSDSFLWTLANVVDSRDGSRHYIFPFIDWRTDIDTFFTTATADIRQMLPCVSVPGFFSRMEAFTGFSFIGNYITSDAHQNMILTPDEFEKSPETLTEQETKASKPLGFNGPPYCWTSQIGELIPIEINLLPGSTPSDHVFLANPVFVTNDSDFFNGSYFTPSNHIGKLTLSGVLKINWDKLDIGLNIKRKFDYIIRIKKDGLVIAESFHTTDKAKLNQENSFPINLTTGFITLESGPEYFAQIEFRVQRRNVNSTFLVCPLDNTSLSFTHTPTKIYSLGDTINLKDIFKMKASDVLKDIMNKRGVMIQTNNYSKTVQFNFFQDIIDNKSIAKNWSKKIGKRSNNLKFIFGNYGRKNWFRFKEDEDVTNELGDFFFNISNENLKPEQDVVKFNHSATEQDSRHLGLNVPEIEAINSSNEWQKPTYRILQMESASTDFNVTFTDGVGNTIVTTDIPICKFLGMEELAPEFYDALLDMLNKTKAEIIPIKLTAIDIHELNHIIPIYLSLPNRDIEGYFYLNVVDKYRGGETNCELIRL